MPVNEPMTTTEIHPIDMIFGVGGFFHDKIGDSYEVREAQVDLAKDILTCFQERRHFIGEAPCGTGKSFGYLGPAFATIAMDPAFKEIQEEYDYEDEADGDPDKEKREASKDETRIVVATAKISLQEQLMKKDLPTMASVFSGKPIKYCLIKGRNNFLCHDKLEQAQMNGLVNDMKDLREKEIVRNVFRWAEHTIDGDKSQAFTLKDGKRFTFNIPDNIWENFAVSDDDCKKKGCEFYNRCFTKKNRKEAHKSDIIVANYHIVLIDLFIKYKGGRGILPPYRRVVFDEAHNLEEIAREFFGKEVSNYSIRRIIAALKEMQKPVPKSAKAKELEKQVSAHVQRLETENKTFFSDVEKYHQKQQPNYIRTKEADIVEFAGITNALSDAAYLLNEYGHSFVERDDEAYGGRFIDRADEGKDLAERIEKIIKMEDDAFAYWIDVQKSRKTENSIVKLKMQPVYVNEMLKAVLWDRLDSAILVSATLAEGGELRPEELFNAQTKEMALNQRFGFVIKNLGLDPVATKKFICPSPFDFQSNCALVIPQEFPEPVYQNQAEFRKVFLEKIQDAIIHAGGRALVLFTSHAALKDFYENCHKLKKHFKVYAQGLSEENKAELVDIFKQNESSVLLGTASYWEGIDCPGDTLSLCVVEKLPFAPMNDPLLDALKEKDPRNFWEKEYEPRTIIKFKQGIGRLIRTKTDRGLLVVADKRAYPGSGCKRYSYKVYHSIPSMPYANNIDAVKQYFDYQRQNAA
jgi:ATP-dependent DNA helicase DinG